MEQVAIKNNGLVVKSNQLVEASYRLDLVEQRIILAAIVEARATQKGLGDDFVTLDVKKFGENFGMEQNNVYAQVKQALNTLFQRYVVIKDIHPESKKERITKVRWINVASYIDGAGLVQLRFTSEMVPFITRLESEFTTYRLEKIGPMTSVHAVRLYELLVQHLTIGKREVEIEWFKQALELRDEYPRISDLKRRVIDIAVAQINEFSDIEVSYEQRKDGKTITHLIFSIKPQAKVIGGKKKKAAAKPPKINKAFIEKHAHPGESYDMAYRRLMEANGQGRLLD